VCAGGERVVSGNGPDARFFRVCCVLVHEHGALSEAMCISLRLLFSV
jgi:hypothetical protein